jgi:hypothetical protein
MLRSAAFFTGIAFAAALLALLPLRLVAGWVGLDETGLSAREVRGSVWSGRLSETRIAGLLLGDLHAGLEPLPLLVGRVRVAVRLSGGGRYRAELLVRADAGARDRLLLRPE